MKRILAWLLMVAMLTALGGCKPDVQEEFGVTESFINREETQEQSKPSNPAEEQTPAEDPQKPTEVPEEPETPTEESDPEEPSAPQKPVVDAPQQEPTAEPETPATPTVPLPEDSGVPITIMVQNLRTGGYQTADTQGQREDTLGRTGQANELYSRARRFRENVKRVDPDVILGCEGTIGWVRWFETDAYFKNTYGLVYHWADGGEEPVGNDGSKPILYKTAKYNLLDSGVFWYSETPNRPSFFKEGTSNCTWAKLQEKTSGQVFYAYAIHIRNDVNEGGITGFQCMDLLNQVASELPEGSYAFFGGDYNIRYQDIVYQSCVDFAIMPDLKDVALNMANDGLAEIGGNTGSVCPEYERESTGGNYGTPKIIKAPNSQPIDHLMAKANPRMAVDYWGYDYTTTAVPAENVAEGYVSDHYALVVKLRIATEADYSAYQIPYSE